MKIVVYHKTINKAKRAHRPKPGEIVWYKTTKEFSEDFNNTMDKVLQLHKGAKKRKD